MNTTSNFEKNIAVVTPINKDHIRHSNNDYMEQQVSYVLPRNNRNHM